MSKKRCPECGSRTFVEEPTSTNEEGFTRTPLVCEECGHVELLIGEDRNEDEEIIKKTRPKLAKPAKKEKKARKKK